MNVVDAYLAAADQAAVLLSTSEVAEAWQKPSALPEMSVGALAGHLAYQILSVDRTLREPVPGGPPIALLDHYARAAWIGEPLDGEVNTGIRAKAAGIAAHGPQPVSQGAADALADQHTTLRERFGDGPVFLPQTGRSLTLDDFLTTRLLELVVHTDDLAVSVGLPTEVPDGAFDAVLVLLTRLAARRHGPVALLRALARTERAPAAVNAI